MTATIRAATPEPGATIAEESKAVAVAPGTGDTLSWKTECELRIGKRRCIVVSVGTRTRALYPISAQQ